MNNNDWQEIRELRKEFMGTSKGIALGNLIAEHQRLDQVRQIVNEWNNDASHSFSDMCKINGILKE